MIVSLEEAKQHMRIDIDDDDPYIQMLINAAEQFITDATGKTFDSDNALAKTACLLIIADLYDNRGLTSDGIRDKTRDIVTLILTQLALSG
jgi:uncharacterized phage protein (predicted DNA packaging)